MTVAVLRPNGVPINSGWTTYGSPSPNTLDQATKDNSSGTGARYPTATGVYGLTLEFAFGTVTIPATAVIKSVTPRVRAGGGAVPAGYYWEYFVGRGVFDSPSNTIPGGQAMTTYTGAALTTRSDGAAWTQADVDGLWMDFTVTGVSTTVFDVEEVYIDVNYNEAPVVSSITPSTTQNTSRPMVTWVFTDPESDAQERYQIKVFKTPAGGWTGFAPETNTVDLAWDSGVQYSNPATRSHQVGADLANGQTYRVYMKASDTGGGGGRYSPWASSDFTVTLTPPPTPTLAVTTDSALARYQLVVDPGAYYDAAQRIVVQKSLDGGVTWTTVRGANEAELPAAVPAIRSPVVRSAGSATSASITKPTGLAVGDTVVLLIKRTNGTTASTFTLPSGFTLQETVLYDASGATNGLYLATKIAGASEPSFYTVTFSGGTSLLWALWTMAIPGAVYADSSGASYYDAFTTITSLALPSVTLTRPGGLLVGFFPDSTVGTPPGMTQVDATVEKVVSEAVAAAGATGTRTSTFSARTGAAGMLIGFDTQSTDPATTFFDYEVAQGATVQYRAQTVASPAGVSVASAWSTTATPTALALSGWWLKDPLYPALNMKVSVAPGFAFKRKEPQSIFEPIGRNVSVVISDGARGIEGMLDVWVTTKARYDKLQALVASGRSLWLEDVFGRVWYIHFGDATQWSLLRAAPTTGETTPIRHVHSVSLPFIEVGSPSSNIVAAGTPTG